MSARHLRWTAAVLSLVLGALDLVVAASPGPLRASALFPDLLAALGSPRYVLVVTGLLLVGLVLPLRRGKRTAWIAAIAAATVSILAHHSNRADLPGMVIGLLLLVALLAGWRAFRAASDALRARVGLAVLLGGLAVVLAYGVLGLYFLEASFRQSTTLTDSVEDGMRLLFLLPPSTLAPATRHGVFFVDSVRVATLVVILASAALLVATAVLRHQQDPLDRAEVEEILDQHATTALAFFQLLDDKQWCFSPDRRAFVGYAVTGSLAVALGEPIGAPDARGPAARAFLDHCDAHGWLPVFHQVTEEGRELLAAAGLRAIKIGEEAVADVVNPTWSSNKSMRSALRRVERAGLRVVELPQPIDHATMEALHAVSDAWLAEGGHRERRFSVGRFDPAYLRATTVLALVDAHGAVKAFANVVPSYKATVGNFDLMRRAPDAPNGAMEAMFVALMDRFRAQGLDGMTLGLAPLAGIDGNRPAERVLKAIYDRGEPFFSFEGLRRFKEKWGPRWEPRYLVYRTDGELPRAAAAVARVGELPDERSLAARAGVVARRFPFTLALLGIVGWLMVATAIDERLHRTLERLFGLGWHDLVHLQLWRLPMSQLIQTRPGLALSNVLLLLVILPLAEWRLGSRLTVVLFFLGDWLSTVPCLVGARVIGGLTGSASVLDAALNRDSGSSSGAWAVAVGLAWSLPRGRLRTGLLALELGFLVSALVIDHREFDVQHLLSAMAGIAIVEVWTRRHEPGSDLVPATPAPEPVAQ